MIRVGTCGFSYNDWIGPYYPQGTKKPDFFSVYVQDFNCVEINVTYYSWISSKAIESMVGRAPAGFRFAVKLHRSLTHETADVKHGIWATKEQNKSFGDTPVQLAQFPNRFKVNDANIVKVLRLSEALRPLVVEFRNEEWEGNEVRGRLAQAGVSVCVVDEPQLPGLMAFRPEATGDLAYVRLHGRNSKKWYDHEKAFERYDYRYSQQELSELALPIKVLSEKAKETLVFFNNHYGAQAVDNAQELAAMLGVGKKPRQGKLF